MIDEFFAKTVNFNRTPLGKVQESLFALSTAKQAAAAAVVGFPFIAQCGATANRTNAGHGENFGIALALIKDHAHHLWNDITRAPNNDGVAHADIFATSLVLVVQCGVGDCDTAYKHRRQFGHRG